MERKELMLVAGALAITGLLKMAEMPVKAFAYFGHDPVVMAMSLPNLPIFADAPSAPEMPQIAMVPAVPPVLGTPEISKAPEAPLPNAGELAGPSLPKKAKCRRSHIILSTGQTLDLESRIHETVRRALAQSTEAITAATTEQ